MQFLKGRVTEAGADVPDVAPALPVSDRQHQCTEVGPGASRRSEASEHNLLSPRRLDLEPLFCARTRLVGALGSLGHDKARDALAVERYQLAIQDGVYFHALQRLSDLQVAMADNLAVAAVKRDAPGFD